MSKTVTVVSAMLDTKELTLFCTDGSIEYISQGSAQLEHLVNTVFPAIKAGQQIAVTIEEDKEFNAYEDIEKKSNGLVKFFTVAKSKIKSWFSEEVKAIADRPSIEEITREIIQSSKKASLTNKAEDETIVAVTESGIVDGIENLETTAVYASQNDTANSVNLLLNRIATVSQKRKHSADSLVKFMEKCDLPLTDDGCILAYKILKKSDNAEHSYYDIHTGKVPQSLGTLVCMAEDLVDHNRSQECSNGLHVARRDYVGGFNGSALTIVKVKPEDVIAVPNGDLAKMRVCAYHIIYELTKEQHEMIKKSSKLDTLDASIKQILGNLVAGNHVGVTQVVEICGPQGTNLRISCDPKETKPVSLVSLEAPSVPVEKVNPEDLKMSSPVLDLKKVHEAVKKAPSRMEKAEELLRNMQHHKCPETAKALLDFKKSSKVSWSKLGMPANVEDLIKEAQTVIEHPSGKPMTKREVAMRMYADWALIGNPSSEKAMALAVKIRKLKKESKLSWGRLGLPNLDDKLV